MAPKTRTNKKHNNEEKDLTSSDSSDNETSSVNLTTIIDKLNKEFKVQERALKKIRESQDHISDGFNALKKEIDRLTEENKQIKKEMKEIKTNGENVKLKMKTLEHIDLKPVIMKIAEQVNANISNDSIVDVFQNENKKFRTHPIIVKMKCDELKTKCFEFRKKGGQIDVSKILTDIDMKGKHVNFHQLMEKELSDLMKKVKSEANKKSYKYVWVKDAKVFVRKDNNTAAILIKEIDDMRKLE
ncbi:intracellular protein transport protein USO1-like [Rhagoletis pomonella]|uniref:intracellular protein transport protein USO1-like n=1 Tax=Rhagoletis pomonella TaxID=28610 RepID=UPI0017828861|nr:intracellular protein transport protein USO1-like [Rhagoletis pomonella]